MIRLKFCNIEKRDGRIWTRFPDGASCPAMPHDTHHYALIAHRCGYGDDRDAYCLEHEFFHAFVEQEIHDRPSQVLWALAHGMLLSGHAAAYEEMASQMTQRWVRANERPIVGGVDWDGFKRKALDLLGGMVA